MAWLRDQTLIIGLAYETETRDMSLLSDPASGAVDQSVDWDAVWPVVTARLSEDEFVPKFLTEDGVRQATLRVLKEHINVTQQAEIEYGSILLGGDKGDRIDLIARQSSGITAVEFKYPREPRQTQPPWPDHLGGVLSDTYRLGRLVFTRRIERGLQVLVSGESFLGFTRRTIARLQLGQLMPGEHTPCSFTLTPEHAANLSNTTKKKLRGREELWIVNAVRTRELEIIGKRLWLASYSVTAAPASSSDSPA
jgi:hypothetical protein